MSLVLLGIFFFLSFLGIPLAISLGLSSVITVVMFDLPITIISRLMYTSMNSFLLVAVPLFILAGTVMEKGGVADRIFNAAKSYIGRFRGGLGMVNIIASFIFGGISGSSVADVGSLGPLEIKAMTDEGYDKGYSAALTMVTSTLSSVVPPSILMIVAAVAAGQSVGACLAGGFGPAVTLSGIFMIQNYFIARKHGYGKIVKRGFKEIVRIVGDSIPALISPVIILVGMFSGIVTPTEAAALAVIYTLFISTIVYKKMPWKQFPRMIMNAGITAGTILLVAMTASVATYVFAVDQLPLKVSTFMLSISQSPALIMVLMGFIFIIVGMFLDITAAILLLTPVLMPTAVQVGVDPVHFVVFMVTALSIGLSTPPVGVCLFATSLVSKISIEQIVKSSWQFYLTLFVFICVFAMTPQISLIFVRLFT
jgi:tripartite ATP-independent transporter DctM subunit